MLTALVDTTPADMRNKTSINLGYEIVAEKLNAVKFHWRDVLDDKYDVIAFNVFYPTNIFNIVPFLTRNKIEPLKALRKGSPKIIVGGQGVGGNNILAEIADEIFIGEIDYDENKIEIIIMLIVLSL